MRAEPIAPLVKLIFVNRFYAPDLSATSQLLADLAEDLACDGCEVHVIASRQRYDDAAARLPARERLNGVEVHRVPTTRFGRGWLPGRAIDSLTFHFGAYAALRRLVRAGDVVVAKTDPPLISIVAARVARARGARLVNWVQDLFPEVAERLGVKMLHGWPGAFARQARDRTLAAAAANVVPGEGMARRVRAAGADGETVTVIHNWADGLVIQPMPHAANELRARWSLEQRFVVGYSGNLGRAHEFATLIGAAERLRSDADVLFLIVGGGRNEPWLREQVERRGLQAQFRFEPYQPRGRLASSLGAADVHLVSLLPGLEGLIVPSKFYGIAAAGRPTLFVGDPDGEIARIVRETDCGVVVRAGDDAALALAISALRDDESRRAAMGENARRAFEAAFDRPRALALWRVVLQAAAGGTLPQRRENATSCGQIKGMV